MSDHVYVETGYRTTWVEKSMSEGVDLLKFPEVVDENTSVQKKNELEIHEALVQAYPNYIKKKGHSVYIFIFDARTGMWSPDKSAFGVWMNMCEAIGWVLQIFSAVQLDTVTTSKE